MAEWATSEDTGDAKEVSGVPDYPLIFKHMVLAIFVKDNLSRQRPPQSRNKIPVQSSPNRDNFDPTKFRAAMDVALAQLKKYGIITENSNPMRMALTSHGRQKDNQHRKEPSGHTKTRRFDKYYTLLLNENRKRVSRRGTTEDVKTNPQKRKPDAGPGGGGSKTGPDTFG